MAKATAGVLLCVALLLCGSLKTTAAPAAPAAPAEAPKRGSLYDRVQKLYPEKMPPFLRTGFHKFDRAGENVSVGYNRFFLLATTSCSFNAYFYPVPQSDRGRDDALERAVAKARREVLNAHEGADVVETAPVTAEKNGRTFKGTRVTFKFTDEFGGAGKKQKLLSDLYLFRDGDRLVKYRVTFPAAEEKAERKYLEKFLAEFPWPD